VTSCRDIRTELGAYALGVLDPAAVNAVERHLTGCARCRAELAELSLAAGLLQGDAVRSVAAAASAEPPPADQALAAVAEARQRERRSLRRARRAALGGGAAFVVVALLAGGLALRPVDRFAPDGSVVALAPVEATTAEASVTLTSRPWGTQVDLVARAMPPLRQGAHYEVWLVRPDGSRVPAGSFRPTAAGGRARVRLAAAVALADVARIGVTREGDGPGVTVLRAPLA
jgi:predicted anti-sigma-YlaC factor YlaD